jgi:curved DNA-binding protein
VEDVVSLEELLSHLGGFGSAADFSGFRPPAGADQEAALTLTVDEAFAGGRRTITLDAPGGHRTLTVTVPAGVVEGQRLRLAGEGQAAPGGRAGDLYLVIHLEPSPLYQVSGRDVTMPLWVSPWEAALGAELSVPALGGTVAVTLPPGTSTGTKLRLAGRGFPNPKGDPGNLYLEVRIEVPRSLSKDERRAFEQLKKVSRFKPRGRR